MAQINQNINSVINLSLPVAPPEIFTNPQVVAAVKMYINGTNTLLRAIEQYLGVTQKDIALWQYLQPADTLLAHQLNRLYVVAGEALSFGSFVNLYNDAGTLKARKGNSTTYLKPAGGFCSVVGGAALGDVTEVILGAGILPIIGIAPSQSIYLSTTGGVASVTPDTAAGHLEQFLGFGIETDVAYVCISQGVWIKH